MFQLSLSSRTRTQQTCERSECMRADQAPVDALVELPECCLRHAIESQPSLALRMRELGFRPGVRVQIGRKVAGGARLVTLGTARYAVDAATLSQLEVIPVAA